MCKILSLDGGGIRGAAATRFLSLIDKALRDDHETDIRECVDLFAGTSTGSIIALGLATTALSMEDIDALYNVDMAEAIFKENRGWFEIDGVNAPKYDGQGKTDVLRHALGDARIGDGKDGKHVLVASYGIEKRVPVIIKSTNPEHTNLFAYQVADASSAAPTYFPTVALNMRPDDPNGKYWLIDGGVVANNPTMCAICEASRACPGMQPAHARVLSVGTGIMTRKINGPDSRNWGSVGWFTQGHIFDILTDERVVSYQARNLLKAGNYIRVNSELSKQADFLTPPDDAMDDVDEGNIRKLRALGDFWFERYGEPAIQLLLGKYKGPSLDRIEPSSGLPIAIQPIATHTDVDHHNGYSSEP